MTEFTSMEEMLKIQSESLGLKCEIEGKTTEELLNSDCEKLGLHFDLDDLRRKMAYAQPPKCPEEAVLFKSTYPPSLEEKATLKAELDKYSLANGYTYPEPNYVGRSYTSAKYSDARNLLVKRRLTERKRFGVQWIVTHYNNCLNREETEVLIHDEDGEYVEVLFHKVCDLYDYGVCVSNINGLGYKCQCKNKKPEPNVCVPFEDTTELRAITTEDLFKLMA
jgi:hypothetical protein